MVVGYVLVGALAGLIASVVALLLGASFWLAFGLYPLVGSAILVLLPAARMLVGHLADQGKAAIAGDSGNPQGYAPLIEPAPDRPVAVTEAPMRILAVDDDAFILELIPMISAKAGFSEVTPAASGEEALKLLTGSDTPFDCLLLDISMPGMNGIEFCRRVRQIPRYRQTPIVMLTAMRDVANIGDAYRAGATEYATKPFDIEELGMRLRRAQETVHAQRGTGPARQENSECRRRIRIQNQDFELPEELRLQAGGSLVDPTALSSYLTQLPGKEVAGVQMLAVSIDEVEAVYMRSSSQQFVALLEDLAATAVGCFGADQTVMAYTDDATLLVATNYANPLHAINIETDIERRLHGNVSSKDAGIGISVGGPVQLQGAKAERAGMATDRVIALAENRAMDKQGRSVAGLLRR
ncbi:response regulator [Roseovarius sp. 217]|uniref:response regulator n=1 Tax=Roseovarius sp. (strain 217) TaxID=314264 RepID=UPI0000685550|nr:response regulator transcription factor [Roseovarius sp. 217]EAQ24842.1 PAS:GGDEF protein [Roseovarius sp. 217]